MEISCGCMADFKGTLLAFHSKAVAHLQMCHKMLPSFRSFFH